MTSVTDISPDKKRLSDNATAALDLPLEERVAFIRKSKWFGYDKANQTLAMLEDLLIYPKTDRMPNLLIAGDTNNGKTSLIKEFMKRHPPHDHPEGRAISVPVFFMQAPPAPDEGRFYDEILSLLFAPFRATDKTGKKEKEVLRLLANINTKMLVIDEIHNLLAGPTNRLRVCMNAIRLLGNNLKIPIVASGTTEAFRAIHSDDQLANRFRSVNLTKWEYGTEYKRLLASFEHTLPLRETSNLKDKEISRELLRMSEGTLGELVAIISEAAVYAVRNNQESITAKTLKDIGWILPSRRSKAI